MARQHPLSVPIGPKRRQCERLSDVASNAYDRLGDLFPCVSVRKHRVR